MKVSTLEKAHDELLELLDEVSQMRGQWYTTTPRQRRTHVRNRVKRAVLAVEDAREEIATLVTRAQIASARKRAKPAPKPTTTKKPAAKKPAKE